MRPIIQELQHQASRILLDKDQEFLLALTCVLAQGHLLIEDQPGVGKTTLVQMMSKLLGLQYSRIQFTNDLLPADILGNSIFDPKANSFQFHAGPLFAQLVLADELNRASPRTQSALLQSMEEGNVTIDGTTHNLPQPFIIMATQNPLSQVGTSPLPESQLDRFHMSLEMHFASPQAEAKIIQGHDARSKIKTLPTVIHLPELLKIQSDIQQVHIADSIANYISQLLHKSRDSEKYKPLSIRAGIALAGCAKAYAWIKNRDHVWPEDVQAVAPYVFAHRLGGLQSVTKGQAGARELLAEVALPR
ncbi:MAG: AAA family ATPase [Pseudobdellovibrionaceae bacterium]